MSKTNCINCGAAKDTSDVKCPFCGTTYLDFTAIDFTSDDPVACAFVMPYSHERVIITMLARPRLNEITMENNYTSISDGFGIHHYVVDSQDIRFNLSFEPVIKPGSDTLFTLKKE